MIQDLRYALRIAAIFMETVLTTLPVQQLELRVVVNRHPWTALRDE